MIFTICYCTWNFTDCQVLLSRNSKSKSRSFPPSQSLSKITIIPSKLFRHFMGALTKVSLIPGDWRCKKKKDKRYRRSIHFPSFFKLKNCLKQLNMQRKKYFYQNTKYKNCILFFISLAPSLRIKEIIFLMMSFENIHLSASLWLLTDLVAGRILFKSKKSKNLKV